MANKTKSISLKPNERVTGHKGWDWVVHDEDGKVIGAGWRAGSKRDVSNEVRRWIERYEREKNHG